MTGLADAAATALAEYRPETEGQEQLRRQFLDHLARHDDGVWKTGPPVHLTTSTFVFADNLDSVLLVAHRKARLWLQPGGHLEPGDDDLPAAALREATEETGLPDLQLLPGIVHLDRHTLAESFGRCREHLDVRYAAIAPAGSRPAVSAESEAVEWWPLAAFPQRTDPSLPAAMRYVADRLRTGRLIDHAADAP